ncbi:MAG: hypothetical protein HQ581_10910 [Planctomycetes bacterium]|nr:hypothetical protein [Planctomycetota bacterium]
MNTRIAVVRLSGVTALAFVAALFVVCYSKWFRDYMDVVHQATSIPPLCEFLSTSGWLTFLLPGTILLAGVLTLKKQWEVRHEVVIVLGVVLAVSLVLLCLVAWRIACIPIFSGMRWHY